MQTERTGRRSWGRCMVLLGMMVVVVAAADGLELLPSQCKKERDVVINSCQGFVFGQAASPVCCEQVKVFHFECLCPAFTPKLVALFDVNKAIKLLQDCGRRVPRHFKCGSKLSLSPKPLSLSLSLSSPDKRAFSLHNQIMLIAIA